MESKRVSKEIQTKSVTNGPKNHFFGYYDKCPWDATGRYMLAMETDFFIERIPNEEDVAAVGLIDTENNFEFKPLARTRAWSWQQGCMLQWLGPDFKSRIIYNDRENDKFVSIILDLKTAEKTTLPAPVYSVSPKGDYAITLNFSRIRRLRDSYGYAGVNDLWRDEAAPEKDGVWLLNLKTGEYKLVISTKQLFDYKHLGSMDGGQHWVDHLMFNTDGSRFCFLHRWQLSDGGMYMRLFSANPDGNGLYCLLDSGSFSHFGWRSPTELLGWGRLPNKINQFRKNKWMVKNFFRFILPIYHFLVPDRSALRRKLTNDNYLLFHDQTDKIEKVGTELLNEDGHCSWSPDGKWILTDTYPDEEHYRSLILYSYSDNIRVDVGKFCALPDKKYEAGKWDVSGMRCDLHPRWNRDGTKICIDSVHEGSRQMYVLDVRDIVGK